MRVLYFKKPAFGRLSFQMGLLFYICVLVRDSLVISGLVNVVSFLCTCLRLSCHPMRVLYFKKPAFGRLSFQMRLLFYICVLVRDSLVISGLVNVVSFLCTCLRLSCHPMRVLYLKNRPSAGFLFKWGYYFKSVYLSGALLSFLAW
jgi:ribosomal protein L30/L7E